MTDTLTKVDERRHVLPRASMAVTATLPARLAFAAIRC